MLASSPSIPDPSSGRACWSWLMVAAFGAVYYPKTKNGQWDYTVAPNLVGVSHLSPRATVKGEHITTFTPLARERFNLYIAECGYKMGKGHVVKSKDPKTGKTVETEVVDEPGLSTCREDRLRINALFVARFMNHMPWPRPFSSRGGKGLLF